MHAASQRSDGRQYGFKTTLLVNADRYALLSALNKLRGQLTGWADE